MAVSLVAALSIFFWLWAVRRPAPASPLVPGDPLAPVEPPPLVYVAVGAQTGLGLDNDAEGGRNWVDILREEMPEGTRLITLGRRNITLSELNQVEIPAAVDAHPDIVTLWNVISDAVKSVPLPEYIKELNRALSILCRGTKATILLLNLPDISLLAADADAERQALVRGGVEQWNRAISDALPRYGKRVRLVDLFPISDALIVTPQTAPSDAEERNALLAGVVWRIIEEGRLLPSR